MHAELHKPTKRSRTADVVRAAVNAGRPLPLAVMLENMWHFRDEAIRIEGMADGDYGHDATAAKACRFAAQKCAEGASPYIHPKLASVSIRPEDEEEAEERRAQNRLTTESLKGKDVHELGRLYLAIAKGDVRELEELTQALDASAEAAEDTEAADQTDPPTETP